MDATGPTKVERKLVAILAADVVGYSRLMGADEEDTFARLKAHRRELIDPQVVEHHGRVVKLTGDGLLIEFPSVVEAVRCAVKIQQVIADRNAQIAPEKRIEFRIGINLGDVIVEDGDIYGDGVNIAARLEATAVPGGICISARVLDEIRTKVDLEYEDLGERQLKNIAHPVRAYHVRNRDAAIATVPPLGAQPLALPDKPSIAVLSFTNMSGNPDQEFLGDGIAEDVLTELSRLRWLFVIARNSSFTYKGKAVDIKQVGRELGVRYVLEGSVRRSGNRVRVTGQLIDAISGAHVWADRYDRQLDDIFAVQDEITAAVAAAIAPAIVDAEQHRAVRKPPENLGAWEAYQRGLWHMSKQRGRSERLGAHLLPTGDRPRCKLCPRLLRLATTYLLGGLVYQQRAKPKRVKLAEPLARQAVALDGHDADVLTRVGLRLNQKGDREGALREAEQALLMSPNCVDAYGLKGAVLIFSGRHDEGRAALEACLPLSPRDPRRAIRLSHLAASHYLEGNYSVAVETARRSVGNFPSIPQCFPG